MFACDVTAMEQLPLAAVEPAKPDNSRRPKAPPMKLVRRALATALYYLHALDRCDPGTARTLRKAIYADAGAPLTDAELFAVIDMRTKFADLVRSMDITSDDYDTEGATHANGAAHDEDMPF